MDCPGERVPAVRHRLLKSDKLTLKTDFDAVKESGRSAAGALLVTATAASGNSQLQAGVICGRKFCTKAVVRNRARRLVWESFRQLKPSIKPGLLVFIPRQRIKHKRAICGQEMVKKTDYGQRMSEMRCSMSAQV